MHLLRNSVVLAGSFAVGYPLAMVLHELGHALAAWLTGGTVRQIMIHPFSWSYTWYAGPSEYPRFTTWAGAIFGVMCGVLLLWITSLSRNPWLLLCGVTALCTFAVNGLYLGIDAALHGGGDGTTLARLGTPIWTLLALSLILLLLGIVSGCLLMPRIGVVQDVAMMTRLAILAGGVGPYLLAMWIYHLAFNPYELKLWTAYLFAGLTFLAVLAWISTIWDSKYFSINLAPGVPVTWATSVSIMAAGIVTVGAFLVRVRMSSSS